jgi:hydroxymethylpyrimidine/phosphomethylpyrimidine kinase
MLVTPNLPETAALIDAEVATRVAMRDAAHALLAMGPRAVLVKGGHLVGAASPDLLVDGRQEIWIEAERIDTPNTHGTGCVLASAIAAHLARGQSLVDAVRAGKAFVTEAIRHALPIGHGVGPVDPLFAIRPA